MADKIGYLTITGDHAQRLFNKQSPGTTISLRIKGTVQSMQIPPRSMAAFGSQGPIGISTQIPIIEIEVEEVND